MSKSKRAWPKGVIVIRRESLTYTFPYFMAIPKAGVWVVGTSFEFESGELMRQLEEALKSPDDLSWASKYSKLKSDSEAHPIAVVCR